MCTTCFLITFLEAFINVLAQALTLAIFARVLLSWVPMKLPWGLGEFVWAVTEPILAPIRRALPFMGGIDFSPFIALIAIQTIASILLRLLPTPL
jgi:YggT family protein